MLAIVGLAVPASAAWAATPPVMSAAALNTAFNTYGDAGNHWTGGDGATSVALPDGRVAWLFSDTFLGTVNADHTRPAGTPLVNNSIVVQSGTSLGATLTGGTAAEPTAVVMPDDGSGDFYWNGDGIVEGGVLKVLYNRYAKTGTGPLDFTRTGTALATFALPALTLTSVTTLSVGSDVAWNGLLQDGSYTYIYGSSSAPGRMNFGHVARAAAGSLDGAWQYWTGTTWSNSAASPARLLSGVGTNYSVQKVGSQYVLVAEDTDLIFDPQIVAYTATTPTGPWTGPTVLYTAPEPTPGSSKIVYDAKLHPSLATAGKLLMSYNVNSLTYADNLADTSLYRPRFVDITWPITPPTGTPAAPAGVAVTGQDDNATVTWSAVSGATAYRVWQRDVTGGQTHFARQPAAATTTSSKVAFLVPGHQYEFKVTAVNAAGEGAFSATVTVTPQSTTPVTTAVRQANLAGSIPGSYVVRLKGAAGTAQRLQSYANQLVAQAGGTLGPVLPLTLHGFGATLTQAEAVNLAAHPDVLDVTQDQTFTTEGTQTNPPWHLDRIDQRDPTPSGTYTYPNTGAVRAYVLDTGENATHQEFGGRVKTGFNAVTGTADTPDCGVGHGTGVASMLGGATYGAAKDVAIVPVALGWCDTGGAATFDGLDIAAGVEWAVADAKAHNVPAVINMSLGGNKNNPGNADVDDAVQGAVADGVTVVAAAGNQRAGASAPDDACNISPARNAASSAVITVGATDNTDKFAGFSNYGSCVTLNAPGVAVTRADYTSDTATRVSSGTSFAAPLVAGAAAMVLMAHPDYSPADVKKALVAAATKDKITDLPAGTPNLLLYVEQPPTTAPTNLTAAAQPNGNIALSWTGTGDQDGQYLVYSRDVTAGETAFTPGTDPVTGTSTTATGLQEGHTYEYQVAVSNTAGIGPMSNVASADSHITPPPAPTGLTATAQSDGQIKLSWNALSSNVWYWVYQRDVTAGETTFTKLSLPVLATTMTAGYLTDGDIYEYAVSAANQGGEGPQSGTARATSTYPPPAAPSGLVATATDATVNLSWTASPTTGVWYWVYQRDVTAGQTTFTQLVYPVTTCCTAALGLLTNGDTYEYKVTAIGSGGKESTASNVAGATPSLPVPGAPTGLTAAAGTDGSIKLAWTSPGGDLWYDMWMRDVTAGQGFTKLAYPVTTCCTWTATGLTQNHAYEFKVDAINATGSGATSNVAGATAHYNPPAAPANLRGTTGGDGTIALDWDAPGPGGFYYWIYSRDVTAGAAFAKGVYPTDQTTASLGGLVNDHVYEFKVTADNSGGEGPASTTVQVTSKGGTPATPSGLTATAGNAQAVLKWTASSTANALYYLYQRDSTTGQSWQKGSLPISGTTFTATSLANGDTYQWKVTAANSSGESAATAVASAKPMPPIPAAPTGLTATAGDGKVTLKWTASSTANVYYWLDSRPSGGTWTRAVYPIGTCCTFVYSGLADGTTYDFRLEATNLAGDSAPSNTASAKPMPPIPAAPSGLSATAGDGKVTLKWTASSTANVYYWVEMQSSGGAWTRLKYPVSTCCSFAVSYLADGTTYSFRLRATNLAGDSAASNTASARPLPPLPSIPGTPTMSQLNGVAHLTWTPSTPSNVYYNVEVRDMTTAGGWEVWMRYLTGTSADVYYLRGGDKYQFRVDAENLAGEGVWSDAVTTRMGWTLPWIGCISTPLPIDPVDFEVTAVATEAKGAAPWDNTQVTVTRRVYNGQYKGGDQPWVTYTNTVKSDATGWWSVPVTRKESITAWPLSDGPFRVYVTVRGPNNASWEDASDHC